MIFHAAYWAPVVAREIGVARQWAQGERAAHRETARALPALAPSMEREMWTRARLTAWELAKLF